MDLYEKTGDVDIKVKIGNIIFNILLTENFFNNKGDFFAANHNHSAYEVHHILKGSGIMMVDNEKIKLLENSYCIIGPGVYHTQKLPEHGSILKYCMKFSFKTSGSCDIYNSLSESKEITRLLENLKYFSAQNGYDNILLIENIHEEFNERKFGYYSRIQSLLIMLIINILRTISCEKEAKYSFRQRTLDEKRSEIIELFFSKNYYKDVKPVELAKSLNLSHSQLNRVLKKLYNMSFKQKLLETRIEIAKDMLKNTNIPIYLIAEKVGYSEVSNFSSIFKVKTGMSPEKYRIMQQESLSSIR